MTEKYNTLFITNARQFRLQLLNIYAVGELTRNVVEQARTDAWGAAGMTACCAVREVTRYAVLTAARKAAWCAAGRAVEEIEEKGGTPQQIAYGCCRSAILDRKKIFNAIDDLGDEISSSPMTIDEVVKVCAAIMTFKDVNFKESQQIIPLVMLNYLLWYEHLILFLHHHDDGHYQSLMDQHSQLISHLGLEKSYAKLIAPREDVIILVNRLPMPMVLIKIVLEYCKLTQDDPDEADEIYNRLVDEGI